MIMCFIFTFIRFLNKTTEKPYDSTHLPSNQLNALVSHVFNLKYFPNVIQIKGCISDFLGQNINNPIHLIFPPDPLAKNPSPAPCG